MKYKVTIPAITIEIEAVEVPTPDPVDPTTDPEPKPDPVEPDPEPEPDPLPPLDGSDNERFDALAKHPSCIASWSLRYPDDPFAYGRLMRSGGGEVENPTASYDATVDAMRFRLPPTRGEIATNGGLTLAWGQPLDATTCKSFVVIYQTMISKAMREEAWTVSENGNAYENFKYVNICRSGKITFEHRTMFPRDKSYPFTPVEFRSYTVPKIEAVTQNPVKVVPKDKPDNFEMHPGPDSSRLYRGGPQTHPEQFMHKDDTWQTVVEEFAFDEEKNTYWRVWLSGGETTSLVLASPDDASRGIKYGPLDRPLTDIYLELDTSSEPQFAEPQPDRDAWFRNVVVLKDLRGEDVLPTKGER